MATDQLPVEIKTMKQNKNMLTRNAFLLHPPPQKKPKFTFLENTFSCIGDFPDPVL